MGFALTPRLGLNVPTSRLRPFVVVGLAAELGLPVLEGQLSLALDTTFTRPSFQGAGNDPRVGGDYTFTLHEREIKVGLDAIYRFMDGDLQPFAGLGPILHFLATTEETSFGPGPNHEWNTAFGVEVFGGVRYLLGPGQLVGDVRFLYSGLNHQLTGDTNAGNVTLSVGYRYAF